MGTVRRGVHKHLEEQADQLIRDSLEGVTKHSEKSDILTPWKQQARYRREVYVRSGTPDRSVREGMFHRVINAQKPDLNSRDGIARPRTGKSTSLSDFVEEHGTDDF